MAAQPGLASPGNTNAPKRSTGLPGQDLSGIKVPRPAPPGTTTLIDTFRALLGMTPEQREQALATRPEPHRTYLQNKVREFEALTPEAREQRLTQLELKFYLPGLLKLTPQERVRKLESIPSRLRPLLQERLRQLDNLPPNVRQEVLEYDTTASYFIRVKPISQGQQPAGAPPLPDVSAAEAENAEATRAQRLFVSSKEQQKIIGILPERERKEMEQTLKSFNALPPAQQKACIDSFERFNRMSPEERNQFLKNAARWKAMSPRERSTWRALIEILPPGGPPASSPPLLPGASISSTPATASNSASAPEPDKQSALRPGPISGFAPVSEETGGEK